MKDTTSNSVSELIWKVLIEKKTNWFIDNWIPHICNNLVKNTDTHKESISLYLSSSILLSLQREM
jgi:hypothetical protein